MRKRITWSAVAGIVIVLAAISVVFRAHPAVPASSGGGLIVVAAGENFWGSLVQQLGGNKVAVTSIISDPNADPHEYEIDTADAKLFATANYVVLNGAGYDSWGDSLLSASPNQRRKVRVIAKLLDKMPGDNPHFWYSPEYVNRAVVQMESDLISLDPRDAGYFQDRYEALRSSLAEYQGRVARINHDFAGTKVASTESIFVYLADAAGLNLISPEEFTEAVAEGNDPPPSSIVAFQTQLKNREPRVLVYNKQTVTSLTENARKLAAESGIPTVGMTETIQPPDESFQQWMNAQVISLQNALNARTLGK